MSYQISPRTNTGRGRGENGLVISSSLLVVMGAVGHSWEQDFHWYFLSPLRKTGWRAIDRPKPQEAADQHLLRVTSTDQLETHTPARPHQHTHTLDALSSQTHVLHRTYLSKSRSKTGLLLPHLLCSHSSFTKCEQFVEVICTRVCVCVGVSALVSYPICTINKESMQEHKHLPCHQPQESVSGKKEKEKKKLHVFTKAGAWIAVWNSTEPSSHYCFLFLRTEATTFLYPYHMCLVMICTGDVQKMMFQHALASRPGIRSSV